MFKGLREDIRAIRERDPAAHSTLETLLCYPGLHAIIWYRMAHWCWQRGFRLFGRLLSNVGRLLTGIEIHPGAHIGRRLFIDHGMGVVIGETAVVGDDVTLYQGVSLGGVSLDKGKRHPTLENGVIVGAGAAILGPFTVGAGARIGSNSVVLKEVPAGATMVGSPARQVGPKPVKERKPCFPAYGTEPGASDDPGAQVLECLQREIDGLKERLAKVESERRAGDPDRRLAS